MNQVYLPKAQHERLPGTWLSSTLATAEMEMSSRVLVSVLEVVTVGEGAAWDCVVLSSIGATGSILML